MLNVLRRQFFFFGKKRNYDAMYSARQEGCESAHPIYVPAQRF